MRIGSAAYASIVSIPMIVMIALIINNKKNMVYIDAESF